MRTSLSTWMVAGCVLGFTALFACGGDSSDSSPDGQAGNGSAGEGGGGSGGGAGGESGGGGEVEWGSANKIDLLFMIDNSASMADKQAVLADAIPDLVDRLTNPVCVDKQTRQYKGEVAPGASCDDTFPGSEREFEPIVDIHIGVITSSLGGVGADSCSPVDSYYNSTMEDMAHFITRGMDDTGTVPTYQGKGFLNWDPTGQKSNPPGEKNADDLKSNFTHMVRGAGQQGCGYEMSLEAWRRFLVDPEPYEKIVPVPCNEYDTAKDCRGPEGIDNVVLQQRKDFLRNDSLLAIVMLTDENDCSVAVGGQYYLSLQALDGKKEFNVARGTNACLTDPWSPDCKSCWEVSNSHPECAAGWSNPATDDHRNLRCFEQKRRFGIDFLYPVSRYINALKEPRFANGTLNPVFCNDFVDATRQECKVPLRDPSLIFLTGILGVPWVDVANDHTDLKKGYRPTEQLAWTPAKYAAEGETPPVGLPENKTLWNLILGEVDEERFSPEDKSEPNPQFGSIVPTVDPLDPLMIESVEPRSGTHPITGEALVQPNEHSVAHSINASEWSNPYKGDLQYACVFRLPEPIDCTSPESSFGCDCGGSSESPLCLNESTGQYGTEQFRAKAYPGRRQLAVLKGMGPQAVVASICPVNLQDKSAADYGYRPAVDAMIQRFKFVLP